MIACGLGYLDDDDLQKQAGCAFRDPSKAGAAINLKRVFFYRSCFRFHGSSIDKFKFKTIPEVSTTCSVTDRSILIARSSSTGMEFHEFIVGHSRFPRTTMMMRMTKKR